MMPGRLLLLLFALVVVAQGYSAETEHSSPARELPSGSRRVPTARAVGGRALRIGVGRNNPPYSYVLGGAAVGCWVDLAREAAEAAGYSAEFKAELWEDVRQDLLAGRIDVAAAMADSPERGEGFSFTQPIASTAFALWVRAESDIRGLADLGGRTVAVQRGGAMAYRMSSLVPEALVSFVPEDADALVLLDSGRYEAAVLPFSQGIYFAQRLKLKNVRPLPESIVSVEQRLAVSRGGAALARELDGGLEALRRSGRLEALDAKWLGPYGRLPPRLAPAWLLAALATLVSLLVLALVFVVVLRREVLRRTRELSMNEGKYRVLIESLPQMIFVKDRSLRFVSCNRRFADSLGLSPEEIVGKDDYDLYPRAMADRYRAGDRAVLDSGGDMDLVERWPGPKGEIWVDMAKAAVRDEAGGVTGVVGIFWDVSERIRMEEETRRSLREKELLLHELNHRVKNNLQLINAIIRLELDETPSPELERFVRDTASRISSIAAVHEMLYSSGDLAEIGVEGYLRYIVRGLQATYSRPDRRVDFQVDASGIRMDLSRMLSLGLMANEMITNSLKYAFEGRSEGRISIAMARDSEAYVFRYEDDGVGLPLDFDEGRGRSLGMMFIKSLTRQLDGEVSMSRGAGGLAYELRFAAEPLGPRGAEPPDLGGGI